MRSFSAQYIFTNTGLPLKRSLVKTGDDGTIISVEDTCGDLKEKQSVEFFNGIIIPGFVNCHCHLELSHLRGLIPEKTGLPDFIAQIRSRRETRLEDIVSSALTADSEMYHEGINLCADICNTPATFPVKKESPIQYINMLEVFGIDPDKAENRMLEAAVLAEESGKYALEGYITPHSLYSVSLPLLQLIKKQSTHNKVSSIHFLETKDEIPFLRHHKGPLIDSYQKSGIMPPYLKTVGDHVSGILTETTNSGNLILVHNTCVNKHILHSVNKRENTFWCLCPGSNIFIDNAIPPAGLLWQEGCEIVTGTDSLASNSKLSILSELKILQEHFPDIGLENLIRWGTINGAKALGKENLFGKIEPGLKPGLLLLKDVDLVNLKLLPETTVTRLI